VNTVVINEQTDLSIDESKVKPIVKLVLKCEQRKSDEVSIYFVSENEICRIHGEFFDDPSPTDCISFPMDKTEDTHHHILGEIFICPKAAIDYVLKDSEEVNQDPYRELTLYLVHGLLHLLGYRDEEDEARKQMHALQNKYLALLIKKQLLLSVGKE